MGIRPIGISTQGGSTLQQVDVVPDPPTEGVVAVTSDTSFANNATRIGAGVVPLPAPL